MYLYFRRIFKADQATQGGPPVGVGVDIPEINAPTVQLLTGIDQQPQSKLPAGRPVQAVPEGVDVELVADLALQHRLLEHRADGLPQLGDTSAQHGQVGPELTERDEGGEGGVAQVGRVGRLSRHPLVISGKVR